MAKLPAGARAGTRPADRICYVGQAAVDHDIIGPDFLGQPVLGSGRG